MKQLRISPDLALPLEAVTETFGILAVKRAGKSNAGVVMAEEMFKAGLPWIAIDPKGDWWGMRSSGDGNGPGLPIIVFGGLHQDIPLEPTAGAYVADLVVEQRLTCVLDVSEMTKADQRRFLTAFIRRLYQRNREPLHVFAEEADEYIPQMVRSEDADMVGAWETLVKRGGFRGLGVTLITQRSASLNNDVLTQIQTLFALRTTGTPDRDRVEKWVNYHQAGKEIVRELPTLADGEALLFSPNFLRTVQKIRFRRRETFDSGATPKVGVKARPPVTLADVDLEGIRERMAATIEKAKADDPRELRKRIQQLERDLLNQQQRAAKPLVEIREVEKVVRVEVPVYPDSVRAWMRVTASQVAGTAAEMRSLSEMLLKGADIKVTAADRLRREVTAEELVASAQKGRVGQPAAGAGADVRGLPAPRPAAQARPVPSASPASSNGHSHISRPQQKLLDALMRLEAARVMTPTRTQAAALAGVSPKSSGFEKNVSTLSSAELIAYPAPGRLTLTHEGRSHAAEVIEPPTVEEFQDYLCRLISGPQAALLRALILVYPESRTREQLAALVGVSSLSSGFEKNVSTLSSFGFVSYPERGSVAATPLVFLEDA